ncbi:MAG: hypothetical protein QNJ55_08200 [Xenococcus sp. MO_188.B8]|nr:hypothetical protein [Xenococcus sp. MO_188.B8]
MTSSHTESKITVRASGLPTLTSWHFWIGTYLGTRLPTVRQQVGSTWSGNQTVARLHYQTVSFPDSPSVLDYLILNRELLLEVILKFRSSTKIISA